MNSKQQTSNLQLLKFYIYIYFIYIKDENTVCKTEKENKSLSGQEVCLK